MKKDTTTTNTNKNDKKKKTTTKKKTATTKKTTKTKHSKLPGGKIKFTKDQLSQLEKLAAMQATGEELAAFFDIDYDTLLRIIKDHYKVKDFSEWFKKFQAIGRVSLRRSQFKKANEGNVPMLIWLGKQHLGQSEKVENVNIETLDVDLAEFLKNDN